MADTFNKLILDQTFNNKYNEENFKKFIHELFPNADFNKEHEIMSPMPNEYKEFVRSAKRLCKYTYKKDEYETIIDVLVIKLKKVSSIERARTKQRNIIARYLDDSRGHKKDAALVVFLSEDENDAINDDWRLSLVKMDYIREYDKKSKKYKVKEELTSAKRFSFLIEKNGEKYNSHTVKERFETLLEKSTKAENNCITIEDLVEAFNIEKVSKDFFNEYKNLYKKMCEEIKRLYNFDEKIKNNFDNHKIIIEDFAKKTLGQLVFLYFIQKKGWLGVEKNNKWGSGDKNFIQNLFNKKYCDYDNFFNDVLEYLFYEALALDRTKNSDLFEFKNSKKVCRIPFLNGGLFEPINNYEYTKINLNINNEIFKKIFETFNLYNFTVKEDEPLEKEIAIDPEMLRKVFENLLPENIRKGNGAFYTPREIVHYMCQESLINYLYNKINIKEKVFKKIISKEDILIFIREGDLTYKNKNTKKENYLNL